MKKYLVKFHDVCANNQTFETLEEARAYALEKIRAEYYEDFEEQLEEAIEFDEEPFTFEEWALDSHYVSISEI
jgi:hypothetical protein